MTDPPPAPELRLLRKRPGPHALALAAMGTVLGTAATSAVLWLHAAQDSLEPAVATGLLLGLATTVLLLIIDP